MKRLTVKVSTSSRLQQIMRDRGLKQADILKAAQPYCEEYNVKLSKSTLSQFVSGRNEPRQDKIFILSKTLGVNPAWLMGLDVPMTAGEDEPTDERTQLLNRIIPLIKQMKIEQLKLALSLFEQFQ